MSSSISGCIRWIIEFHFRISKSCHKKHHFRTNTHNKCLLHMNERSKPSSEKWTLLWLSAFVLVRFFCVDSFSPIKKMRWREKKKNAENFSIPAFPFGSFNVGPLLLAKPHTNRWWWYIHHVTFAVAFSPTTQWQKLRGKSKTFHRRRTRRKGCEKERKEENGKKTVKLNCTFCFIGISHFCFALWKKCPMTGFRSEAQWSEWREVFSSMRVSEQERNEEKTHWDLAKKGFVNANLMNKHYRCTRLTKRNENGQSFDYPRTVAFFTLINFSQFVL